jgi:hypothetical protein
MTVLWLSSQPKRSGSATPARTPHSTIPNDQRRQASAEDRPDEKTDAEGSHGSRHNDRSVQDEMVDRRPALGRFERAGGRRREGSYDSDERRESQFRSLTAALATIPAIAAKGTSRPSPFSCRTRLQVN